MAKRRVLVVAGLLSLAATSGPAQQPATVRDAMLVSPAWLTANLRANGLVLLHVGPRAEYDAAHIAGARHVTLDQFAVSDRLSPTGLTLQVPPPASLHATLVTLGISDDSRIVVYSATADVTAAARVIFTLDHAGLGARTSLLDGGLAAWTRAGNATTTEISPVAFAALAPLSYAANVASADWVRDNAGEPGIALVDARATDFYTGVSESGPRTARRRGHIPGAVSLPFSGMVNDRGELRPATELMQAFHNAGIQPGDTVVTYCHIGQQASLVAFAARSLGFSVRLFDGSFEEWAHKELPVDTIRASR